MSIDYIRVPCISCGVPTWTVGSLRTAQDRVITRSGVVCYECRWVEEQRKAFRESRAKAVQA